MEMSTARLLLLANLFLSAAALMCLSSRVICNRRDHTGLLAYPGASHLLLLSAVDISVSLPLGSLDVLVGSWHRHSGSGNPPAVNIIINDLYLTSLVLTLDLLASAPPQPPRSPPASFSSPPAPRPAPSAPPCRSPCSRCSC